MLLARPRRKRTKSMDSTGLIDRPLSQTAPYEVESPFERFVRRVASSSYPLFMAAAAALIWANLAPHHYHAFWHTEVSFTAGPLRMAKSLAHWIDEALMALFFFSVGLEIKREVLVGVLSSARMAVLPIAAALGGMLVPAAIYTAFNAGSDSLSGWGIPMATDIAFSLAILTILGKRIPLGIKIFLTALAIADDLGAVLVIAIFYTPSIVWSHLAFGALFLVLLALANRMKVRWPVVYGLLGIGLWWTVMASGVHATVAGVLLAMFIPATRHYRTEAFLQITRTHLRSFDGEPDTCTDPTVLKRSHLDALLGIEAACELALPPLQRLEHALQSWIAFIVLPFFAMAHAGLPLQGLDPSAFLHPITMGIFFGLGLGKVLGITLFTWLTARMLNTPLGPGLCWRHVVGVGFLGGIGFTMSLFISNLSFQQAEYLDYAKLGILSASMVCGIIGYMILKSTRPA
jgi:Na+:H+ antiporter, NhaA family